MPLSNVIEPFIAEHPQGHGREQGFYPTYAYMNHSCRSFLAYIHFGCMVVKQS
jgi:hypothetical protein